MRKLLKANFTRLFGDKVFLISCAVMFLVGAGFPLLHYIDVINGGEKWTPDSTCFVFVLLAPILLSLMSGLFVGSEYSDGTMRNKLIVGHKRYCIYLANLVVCATAGVLLCIAYIVPHTCLGLALLGKFDVTPAQLMLYIGLGFALVAAFASLLVFIAMLCQNKAYSTAGCILLVFALLFAGVRITSALNEPEYYSGYSYTINGVTTADEPVRNPNYLSGAKRQVYEFLRDFTPGGQVIQLANMSTDKPEMLALYNGAILLFATGFGILFFRRKDLK